MRKTTRIYAVLALAFAAAFCRAGELTFTAAADADTGLKAIVESWHALELERQAGKPTTHGWWPWGLTAFDFDNDGDLDLLPCHHGTPGAILIRNNLKETGKLTFTDITREAAGEKLRDIIADDRPWVWDFDGDGWLDIAGFSDESKPWSYFNMEGKKLEPIANFTFAPVSHATEVRDLNGDGFLDLFTASRHGVSEHLYDPAARTFKINKRTPEAAAEPADFAPWFEELKKGKNNRFLSAQFTRDRDLNGDGIVDLVAAVSGGYGASAMGRYWLGAKDGTFSEKTADLGLPENGTPILLEDLTGDGALDVLVATDEKAGVYVNDGKGKFTRKENALTAFLITRDSYPLRAVPVDLDNDGDMDIVMSSPRSGREAIFENLGNGEFRRVLAAVGWDSNPIATCDINNDGLLDVCVGGPKDTITLYLNTTTQPGSRAEIAPRMSKPNWAAVGATLEVFKAGDLGKAGARAVGVRKASPDATSVHVGLGAATTFDLRVTFPGKEPKIVEYKGLAAGKRWTVTPDGKSESK